MGGPVAEPAIAAGVPARQACQEDGVMSMIDAATNKVAATISVGAYPWAIAITL